MAMATAYGYESHRHIHMILISLSIGISLLQAYLGGGLGAALQEYCSGTMGVLLILLGYYKGCPNRGIPIYGYKYSLQDVNPYIEAALQRQLQTMTQRRSKLKKAFGCCRRPSTQPSVRSRDDPYVVAPVYIWVQYIYIYGCFVCIAVTSV